MAEGFLRQSLPIEQYLVYSAGTDPQGVNSNAAKVMSEIGIDISGNTSNHLEEYISLEMDLIFTVCDRAAGNCPVFPGLGKRIHFDFPDPAHFKGNEEETLEEFRWVRDMIQDFCGSRVLPELGIKKKTE